MNKVLKSFFLLLICTASSLCETTKFLGAAQPRSLKTQERTRKAGILMHITSLPSKYGIGTLGQEAFKFVDFLVKAKQTVWQLLPIHPTGYGDSPYQAFSTFAGNPYMIDLDALISEGLLTKQEVNAVSWGADPSVVDYGILYKERMELLRKAHKRFQPGRDYIDFVTFNDWITDYVTFMTCKDLYNNSHWTTWPEHIRKKGRAAVNDFLSEHSLEVKFHYFLQYKFFEQFNKLRDYAHEKGIQLLGDVPIYVPYDSVDTWANPTLFQFDQSGKPLAVAGVPPDAFTADGQLWGNPLYNWPVHKSTHFEWWIKRLSFLGGLFDIIRIDHFRGLESYWKVPAGDTTARNGEWVKGPGMDFINAVKEKLPNIQFIAEDLGYLTPEVLALREGSAFPGMKILQFAFDPREPSDYLPHTYDKNSVCYTGTHDNDTLMSWQKALSDEDRAFAEKYLGLEKGADLRWPLLRAGMSSTSNLFIAPLQDYLGLGGEARMNRPGIMDGKNWIWRSTPGQIPEDLAEKIADLTVLYNRSD